tara:strand:+ start:287 stop:532 length:246 start_codon:yes stop_codon:yes gene_type:complete
VKLKKPLELTLYPRELNNSGIYSIARLENNEISAVIYHYETEKWSLLPESWIEKIKSIDAIPVAEEILQLNGLSWIIYKKF